MKIKYGEWIRYKKLINEFAEHNNIDGEKARSIAERIKQGAELEIPDDVFTEMKGFCEGIELIRNNFENFWMNRKEAGK